MSGHTPGPWKFVPESEGLCGEIWGGNGKTVAVFTDDPNEADGLLMASAPALLEALVELESAFTDADITSREYRHKARLALIAARAAITKATNQQGNNHD